MLCSIAQVGLDLHPVHVADTHDRDNTDEAREQLQEEEAARKVARRRSCEGAARRKLQLVRLLSQLPDQTIDRSGALRTNRGRLGNFVTGEILEVGHEIENGLQLIKRRTRNAAESAKLLLSRPTRPLGDIQRDTLTGTPPLVR